MRPGRRMDDHAVERQAGDVVQQPVRMLDLRWLDVRALRDPLQDQRSQVRPGGFDRDLVEVAGQVRHVARGCRNGDPLLPLLHGAFAYGRLAEQRVLAVLDEDRADQPGNRRRRAGDLVVRFQQAVRARRGQQSHDVRLGRHIQTDLRDPPLDRDGERLGRRSPGTRRPPGTAHGRRTVRGRLRGRRGVRYGRAVAALDVEGPVERKAEADVEAAFVAVRGEALLDHADRDETGGDGGGARQRLVPRGVGVAAAGIAPGAVDVVAPVQLGDHQP